MTHMNQSVWHGTDCTSGKRRKLKREMRKRVRMASLSLSSSCLSWKGNSLSCRKKVAKKKGKKARRGALITFHWPDLCFPCVFTLPKHEGEMSNPQGLFFSYPSPLSYNSSPSREGLKVVEWQCLLSWKKGSSISLPSRWKGSEKESLSLWERASFICTKTKRCTERSRSQKVGHQLQIQSNKCTR